MSYKLRFTKSVQKQFRKMDKHQAMLLIRWLYQNIDGITDPRQIGKGLTADKVGLWRYRVGDYRIIVEIEDKEMIITAIQVGHRKNVYD